MDLFSRVAGIPGVIGRALPAVPLNRHLPWVGCLLLSAACGQVEGPPQSRGQPANPNEVSASRAGIIIPPAVGVKYHGKQYELEVVAASGEGGITELKSGPSINDNGRVGFSAVVSGGQALFYSDGSPDNPVVSLTPTGPVNVTPSWVTSSRTFFDRKRSRGARLRGQ